ncbi:MAG: hypothetical protein Q8R55_07920 [Candidatus Taylorbacteria bacterium]|nr:hypothetical protein [Candidatus Taylorbacteria bacterium]
MQFTLDDVHSNIHKAANVLPIGVHASRVRYGDHTSRFKGQGPDFFQIVEYDSEQHTVDQIQWHLTDPDGTVYVREAKITKDFMVVVMADLSPSMMFKLQLLFESIGNIGLTCSHAQDPMGFIGFSENIIFDERPRVGEDSVYYLLGELYKFFEEIEADSNDSLPRRETNFQKAFEFFASRFADKHCFLIVISDFIGAEEFLKTQLLKDIANRHEMVCLFLDNPTEFSVRSLLGKLLRYPFGYLRMTDIETGREVVVPIRTMDKIEQEIRVKRKRVRNNMKDMGIDSMVLEYSKNGKHYERLYRFLLHRQEMIKSGGIAFE